MREVLQTIERVSPSDLSVLILGEQGTGKEWAARLIHDLSFRANGPFWPFDCLSMPSESLEPELFGSETLTREGIVIRRGAFEEAAGGTLLLNEIGALPAGPQKKIARALEYKDLVPIGGERHVQVDVRIIATHTQQSSEVFRDAVFDKDMIYRISPILIELPPLRKRREDIPLLVNNILSNIGADGNAAPKRLSPEALSLCQSYHWPGNIRHLKNAIQYASVMSTSDVIQPRDLPSYLRKSQHQRTSSESIEKKQSGHLTDK